MHDASATKKNKKKFIGWCSCEHATYTDVVLHEVGSNMWKKQDTFWNLLITVCTNELLVCTEEP
jgi:hypothetical protein